MLSKGHDIQNESEPHFSNELDEFKENGFDELELSRQLSAERLSLLVRIVKGRYYNKTASGKPHAFTEKAIGRRMGGVSQTYVSHIERGLVDLVNTLTNYANAAGLIIAYEVSSAVDGQVIEDNMESNSPLVSEQYTIEDKSSQKYSQELYCD